ncbi:biotin-dependent carboxyltransferase family protein [Microbulbifer agarilyticus]|uniref:5-oxoprolinase subunit C family protein n=1 Tax=Microbulbifer agarilyticus TaxID=260552 RepID=UPI001C9684D4|nr:biotin-dependent carboxyltransferase family protein [Microbulbifer agarilyticus]MBY6188961.1 biotin-dependent carboxyltransferase family protein [Microbulbifer agarilyticus]
MNSVDLFSSGPAVNSYHATILNPGALALIQDRGRMGSQHLGICTSGVADSHAAGWANRLLGNPSDAAVIELCLGNFRMQFESEGRFAITGAELGWRLNGKPLENWRSYHADAGATLEAGIASDGLRGYLAFSGGIEAPLVCGSRSTSQGDGLGGLDGSGKPLAKGDGLTFECPAVSEPYQTAVRFVPNQFRRTYGTAVTLRIVPSNQFDTFSKECVYRFFSGCYTVASDSDRMGVRLTGDALPEPPGNLVSEAVSPGAIQVPANGQPIVLMHDCQTIGGYPKLGHVYRVDLDRLAQARPGTEVRFVLGNRAESQHEWLLQSQFFSSATQTQG